MLSQQTLDLASRVASVAMKRQVRLVFAESCTCGGIAFALSQVPGISRILCGSFVVYQTESKIDWLGVNANTIQEYDVVSEEVAAELASRALAQTKLAALGVGITGHLGPNAPAERDGLVAVGVSRRHDATSPLTFAKRLTSQLPDDGSANGLRSHRQQLAIQFALETVLDQLGSDP